MKFEAAPITPGRAKTCQNGTEPSAKSTQSVPLSGIPQVSAPAALPDAADPCGTAANAAHAASAMRTKRFTRPALKGSRAGSSAPPALTTWLLAVEGRVDLGHFLCLGRLAGLRVAAVLRAAGLRRAAEVEAEARQIDALTPVGADLLERGQ